MKIFSRFILVILENHSETLDNKAILDNGTRVNTAQNDSTDGSGMGVTNSPWDTVTDDGVAAEVPNI